MMYPSIFNNVIGPVMRGPSSSHTAAAVRIGNIARDLMAGKLSEVLVEFDSKGSLATTHKSQGSDMGLCAGLLGWDAADARLTDSEQALKDAGIKISFEVTEFEAFHPNTYNITLKSGAEQHRMTALSTGGGIIEIVDIDNTKLSMAGDYYETLIYADINKTDIIDYLKNRSDDYTIVDPGESGSYIEIKGRSFLPVNVIEELAQEFKVKSVKKINPVLPVLSRPDLSVPFLSCNEMLKYNEDKKLSLPDLAVRYETGRSGLNEEELLNKMEEIIKILEPAIAGGIEGTEYDNRILDCQSVNYKEQMDSGRLPGGDLLNKIILYVTALMEQKSSMGIVVAAPTAGSCGTFPGACIAAAHELGRSGEELVRAMLAGGLIGIFIAANSTFAAEVCGCQAETGAGAGMAAASLVTLNNGSLKQAIAASSMAIQNTLGMICDPVANRVEVPCLGRNVLGAVNALASANMALADFDPVIPLDEVIDTMDRVGKAMPASLCCTALGGLSITKTSKDIERKLNS
jgi:L-serine dehydratase